MTICDDEGDAISEKQAIKTGLAIIEDCPTDSDSDFDKGLRAMRQLIKAHRGKRMEP